MKSLYAFTFLFLSLAATAQDCSPELLRQKSGTWKAGPPGFIQNVAAADLVKEKAMLAALHKLVTSGYTPTGCQVSYSFAFGKQLSAGISWLADPYYYALYILPFICEGHGPDKSPDKFKYRVAISSATNVNIAVNEIFFLNTLYAANLPLDDSRGYFKLTQRPQQQEGAWFLGEEIVGDKGSSSEIKEYRWLITYNDTLPFRYLSRKEYLLIQAKRLQQAIKESPGEKDYLQKFISNINEYLTRPEADLNQPAIARWNEEERFEKFVEEGTPGAFFAVKPNPDYYHKSLSKSTAQFISVVYKISAGEPVLQDNMEALKKAIDFKALKNLLGR